MVKLKEALNMIDRKTIHRRRIMFIWFYHKIKAMDEPGKGISFQNVLRVLAQHNLVVHKDASTYVRSEYFSL